MSISRVISLTSVLLLLAVTFGHCADPGRKILRDDISSVASRLVPIGQLPATTNLILSIGLPLRNETGLDELLAQLYDPQSTNYHKFLTPEQFAARFGPTEADYAVVKNFALTNGFVITGTNLTRLSLDVRASAANVGRAFQVAVRTYRHPREARDFFAPDVEPTVGALIPIQQISGLDNYSLRRPLSVVRPLSATAQAVPHAGSGPGGNYLGDDFRAAYVPGTTLIGSGQSVALVQFDAYDPNDIAAYVSLAGLTNYPINLTNVDVNGGVAVPGSGNIEVCLDIEMVISMAPGVSKIIVYEAPNAGTTWSTMLGKIASDNLAKQISCSWGNTSPGGKDVTSENYFKQMASQGQSFFNATGDSDAFVGGIPFPSESPNITQVGGTTLSTTGPDGAWSSESAWNWGGGTGSSGGVSANYWIPGWQTGISMISNHGSTASRNVPDVALTGDNVFVTYNNGGSTTVGGTSCAAPLWAGFMALVNEQAAAAGQAPVGFINPAVYTIGKSAIYNSCFNDTTVGNNFNPGSPTNFPAVAGFDLCTGWGTPNGTNLINALLAPPPLLLTLPVSRNVTNGANVTFTSSASSSTPIGYSWSINGTNLSDGGNISGTASNVLSITSATTNDSGNYQLVVTNATGASSSVAILNVGFAPTLSVEPASQTNLTGSSATFVGTAGGSTPLAFHWRRSGTNIVDGAAYSGVTTSSLTLTAIDNNEAGNYTLVVTNLFGAITSSVIALTVVSPPTITSGITNRDIECGSNVIFTLVATGTAPLRYQWSIDGTPTPGATNASLSLTNVHLPSHIVTVVVTNLYASATSNAVLTVNDTESPVITLSGSDPLFLELGDVFNDPGASATDVCAGSLTVAISGIVNPSVTGTNALIYESIDGNGNTSTATRNVVVRDTVPPTIAWSFTNSVLAADANCGAIMPDVTGTNFILAIDLSGALTISQSPASDSILLLGTNLVVITVSDASTNKAFSTNTIIVSDQTPPLIVSEPQSQTNTLGTTADFSAAATACTPLVYRWFFNNTVMADETNQALALVSVGLTNAGNYSVVVSAAGGSATSAVATLTVDLIASSLTLDSSVNPSGYKDDFNLTAVISPADATGTVEFFTNGVTFDLATLAAGAAVSPNISSLPRGPNDVSAFYSGDARHLPATNTITQIVTNHPPVAAADFYSFVPGFPLEMNVADLAVYWTDIDDDPISLTEFSVSTNGIVLASSGDLLVYFNTNRVADQFFCTISDGWDTNFQTVNLVPPADPTPNITSVATRPDGSLNLDLIGAPGYTYILETTTNLASAAIWQPVTTNTLGTNGVWQFTDLSATNFPQQFYRLKLAP